MVRTDREIKNIEGILEVIDKCDIIRLGLCDDGEVYIVPMNFGYTYENETLTFYLHGAVKGRKYDVIAKNPRVGFELECDTEMFTGRVPCQYGMQYASVIGNGTAEMITDSAEKIEAMKILMKTQTGKDFEFTDKLLSIVNMFKVTATSFSGKRRLKPEGNDMLKKSEE